MVWYRPTSAELDKLEALGNPGWNWNNLEPHMVAAERNIPPDKAQVAQGAASDPDVHGRHGLVNTSFPVRFPQYLTVQMSNPKVDRYHSVFPRLSPYTRKLYLLSSQG
jgi:choline dehydrogenase-like flavoprotein